MGDPQFIKFPKLKLSQRIFQLSNPEASPDVKVESVNYIKKFITKHDMAPLYKYLADPVTGILNAASPDALLSPGLNDSRTERRSLAKSVLLARLPAERDLLSWSEDDYNRMVENNTKELEAIHESLKKATEQDGDVEILAALGKEAEFYARIGDKEKAIKKFTEVFDKTGVVGTKIDILLAIIRIGLFFGNKIQVRQYVDKVAALIESGGDWDRRNRFKAYQGLHLLTIRSYDAAAPLLLDSLSTFTSYELCTYSSLVVYATLAGSVALKRVDFKTKVVDAPEIKAILGDPREKILALSGAISAGPSAGDEEMSDDGVVRKAAVNLSTMGRVNTLKKEKEVDFSDLALLVGSLYQGDYKEFFQALARVETNFLSHDRYLYEHRRWYIREMRLRGYQQLLQSYRVVSLDSMAADFGVTFEYIDLDLSKFISSGRIACTIDRVGRLVETNRPDDKNKQYMEVLKVGDQLITKLQKYGQSVRLRGAEL